VAATGTGKTIISGFDYKRFVLNNSNTKSLLLFVVDREEILKQSLYAFR
jgi:superfamily II DNA or RNA helicase